MRHFWSRCYTKYCQAVRLLLAGVCLLAFCQQALAIHPSLVDLGVNETKALELTTGVEYLLVLRNENPHSTRFYFGDFAQSVFTRSMQGAAGVAQDSVDVPANGKVLWLFSPDKEGEYTYYAVNGSSDQKGARGKLIVKLAEGANDPMATPKPNEVTAQAEVNQPEKGVDNATVLSRRWLKGGRRD